MTGSHQRGDTAFGVEADPPLEIPGGVEIAEAGEALGLTHGVVVGLEAGVFGAHGEVHHDIVHTARPQRAMADSVVTVARRVSVSVMALLDTGSGVRVNCAGWE